MQYSKEQFKEAFYKLPSNIRLFLLAEETADLIKSIGEKNKLSPQQTGDLANESHFVVAGLTPPGDYVKNIVERLKVPQDVAVKLAQEVNTQVFSKKDSYTPKEEPEVEEVAAPTKPKAPESFLPPLIKKPEVSAPRPVYTLDRNQPQGGMPKPLAPAPSNLPVEPAQKPSQFVKTMPTTSPIPANQPVPVAPPRPSILDSKLGISDPYREPLE